MLANKKVVLLGGSSKASIDFDYSKTPQIDSRLTFTRSTTATCMAYAPTAVAGDLPILTTCAIDEPRFTNARRVSQGVWSAVLNDGSAIPLPISLLAEEARANICLQNDTLTTLWQQFGTVGLSQNVIGIDGQTSAWTLTDSTSAIAGIQQTVNITSGTTYTLSLCVKKTIGAQSSYPVFEIYRAGAGGMSAITIDTTNGIVTTWTAYTGFTIVTNTATCESISSNFWRVKFKFVPNATEGWLAAFIPAATTNPIQSSGAALASVTGTCVATYFQIEAGDTASSIIPTTTLAVTRTADSASFTGAGLNWYNPTQGTFVIAASGAAFNVPYNFGAMALTYASQTKYALAYNNNEKSGSAYLYTAATISSPTEFTGVAVPTTIYVNSGGIANISRFTYYPKKLKPSKIANLL
jgi:hypothetical protein